MGLECPLCGVSEVYIIDDPNTAGKKQCKGCGCKFMPTGSMFKAQDPLADEPAFKKEEPKNEDKPTLHRIR